LARASQAALRAVEPKEDHVRRRAKTKKEQVAATLAIAMAFEYGDEEDMKGKVGPMLTAAWTLEWAMGVEPMTPDQEKLYASLDSLAKFGQERVDIDRVIADRKAGK
jgi:hypothetical protein